MAIQAASDTAYEGWDALPELLVRLIAEDRERAGRLLGDPDRRIRRFVTMALAGVDDPWAPELLAEAVADAEPEIRALAAESAQRWYDDHPGNEVLPSLQQRVPALLEDPCEEVRLCVAGAVARLGGEAGVARLVDCFAAADEVLRGEILGALALYGHYPLVWRLAGAYASDERSPYLVRLLQRLAEADPRSGRQREADLGTAD
ncbi:HEAT repeat domain-containing protein [Carboxydochorda subterranea]|uniref:HEAT repeat domain-containing protein n=1 Tax=Carboxydichorda subterranea TaxID=3109565 RepID=A0ABZ1BUY6_9FIRM|nr:HEAT repeat domain-containing protein [Limnochorda sp. L945t]WRP16463.1 HEAT repeat domain-containing protein [Limnochorda sp. L945t]